MKIDFLVVGQGVAGTMLAYFLEKAGQEVRIIDQTHHQSASAIAAGIMNPITGRRFVKSWLYDTLRPFAIETYQQIEQDFNFGFVQRANILRSLPDTKSENDWAARAVWPEYAPYINQSADLNNYAAVLKDLDIKIAEVKGSYQIHLGQLIRRLQSHWRSTGALVEEPFDFDQFSFSDDGVYYKNHRAKGVFFCEGQRFRFNPFFSDISPLQPSKGEILMLTCKELDVIKMIKRKIFLVPMGDHQFWFGARNSWELEHANPTAAGLEELKQLLHKVYKDVFSIDTHLAAIRPTVIDRRPFMGTHPTLKNVHVFNGLGTKGASLAPYWAKAMVKSVIEGGTIEAQVNINRFY